MTVSIHLGAREKEVLAELDEYAETFEKKRNQLLREAVELVLRDYRRKAWVREMERCEAALRDSPLETERQALLAR